MIQKFFLLFFVFAFTLSGQTLPYGFTKIKTVGGITEYRYEPNGLSVLLMEEHSAPVLTFMVTYRVGSKNEVTGNTGSTHLLEHLMFKGTPKYNKANGGHIDNLLGNIGAMLNASTWNDRTNYFESIPSEYLELAIDIESDRMRNLSLKKEDKDAEMTVVRNEYERGENDPFSALDKEIWAAAFMAHPYSHSTIGWKSDIENVPMEDLRAFYNTFYYPNNAFVTIIGDFQTENALELVKKYFGAISKSPKPIPHVYTTEPEQQGLRRVEVNRAGQLGVVGIAHKVPEGLNKDSYALSVLDYILTSGKTSRLYKSLIDKNKAVNVFDYFVTFEDPSLFTTYAFLTPGTTHEEVEKIILEEYERIRNEGVTNEEVEKIKSQIIAETAYGRDGSYSIASQINEAIAAGDWTSFVTYVDNIKNVTPENVKEVVAKYFNKNQRTIGYFIPKTSGEETEKTGNMRNETDTKYYYRDNDFSFGDIRANAVDFELPDTKKTSIAKNIDDEKISGIRVLSAKTGVQDVVTFRGSFAAGDIFSKEKNSMIANLTGSMLDKGTTKNDKFALAGKLEKLGASINFSVNNFSLAFNGKCLKKDLPQVIDILAEELRYPLFSSEEFEKVKVQKKGSMKQMLENTNIRSQEKMNQLIFPKNHPNNQQLISTMIEDIDKVTLDDIKNFHAKYYGPKSMIFVLVGDIEKSEIKSAISKSFSGWNGGVDYPSFDRAKIITENKTEIVRLEDKTSATLRFGQITGLKRSDKDFIPFTIANEAFGGGSFTARLMSIIRDEEGLTYGIYSGHSGDVFSDGSWFISGTFSPDLLHKGYSSTLRELKRWINDGLTEDELKNTKSRLAGSFKVQLATTGGMAAQILSVAERGLKMSYLDEFPEMIQSASLKDVNNSIKKYLNPDKIVTVVAGTVTEEDLKPKN
jgi:zinc protease